MRILILLAVVLFAATVNAATVDLSWDANTDADLTGYKIYYGNYSGNSSTFVPVGSVPVASPKTTGTVAGLSTGKKWFFRVTALSGSMESLYSNVVQVLFIKTPTGAKFQRIDIR